MKLVEALKQKKDLERKAADIRQKISTNCALSNIDTPEYGEQQREKVSSWLQAHSDIIKEILRLRVAIQRTNLETEVTVELGGWPVTKSIAEWIHRRESLAAEELKAWKCLTDRGIKEGNTLGPAQSPIEIKLIRFYDPEKRDEMVELFASEKPAIDSRLEVVNAVTDLIE